MVYLTEYGDFIFNAHLDEWGRLKIDGLLEDGVSSFGSLFETLVEASHLIGLLSRNVKIKKSGICSLVEVLTKLFSLEKKETLKVSESLKNACELVQVEFIQLITSLTILLPLVARIFLETLTLSITRASRVSKTLSEVSKFFEEIFIPVILEYFTNILFKKYKTEILLLKEYFARIKRRSS